MCGRFILSGDKDTVEKVLKVSIKDDYVPRFNISPTQTILTLTGDEPHVVTPMKWGMEPTWWKFKNRSLINVRAESLKDKPWFKSIVNKNRCIILADGFYEWDKSVQPSQPYLFRLKHGEPFGFPGVWEHEGDGLACALITVSANGLVSKIHDRMPAIVEPSMIQKWIQQDQTFEQALEMVEQFPASKMVADRVGPGVKDPHVDDESLISAK